MEDTGTLNGLFRVEKFIASPEVENLLARHTKFNQRMLELGDPADVQEAQFNWQRFVDHYAENVEEFSNILLNSGITLMWQLITATGSPTAFTNSNSRIVLGTSSTAAVATQTGVLTLLATLTIDGGYPSISNQTVTFRATAGTATANGNWQEYCVTNGTTAINRATQNVGVKTTADIWVANAAITLS